LLWKDQEIVRARSCNSGEGSVGKRAGDPVLKKGRKIEGRGVKGAPLLGKRAIPCREDIERKRERVLRIMHLQVERFFKKERGDTRTSGGKRSDREIRMQEGDGASEENERRGSPERG